MGEVGSQGSSRAKSMRAKSVGQVDEDSDMAPTCSVCGRVRAQKGTMASANTSVCYKKNILEYVFFIC